MTFGSIFARFRALLKGEVSWRSPGEYSMIGCSLGDALGGLSHHRPVAVLYIMFKSGETLCNLFMVLYLYRKCQCGLRSQNGILVGLLAVEPRSTPGLLFRSQCLYGSILPTLYSMVWDFRVSRAGLILFYWPTLLASVWSSTLFTFFYFFLLVGTVGLESLDW